MRIFLAGATGVMGRRVVPSLVKAGHSVTALGRSQKAREELERLGTRPVEPDLFDAAAVREAVAGHDVVINLATSIPPLSRIFVRGAWRTNDRIRSQASTNLVEAAAGRAGDDGDFALTVHASPSGFYLARCRRQASAPSTALRRSSSSNGLKRQP